MLTISRTVARVGLGAVAATGLLASSLGAAPAQAVSGKPVPPLSGAWFGAHVNPRYGQGQLPSITAFQTEIGRRLDVVNRYHAFSDHTYTVEAALLASGRVPLISWRGTDNSNDPNRAAEIAAGKYDATIDATADAVKALGGGVLIRFNWEMDQSPGSREYIGTAPQFVAAWQHIVSIFQSRGASNAAFVWAPRSGAFSKGVAASYYPGDSYVDWIGASSVPTSGFPDFHNTFASFYAWSSTHAKPLLVWAGVRENPQSSTWKADWMTSAASTIETSMPKVKAFVYYDALSPLGYAFWADTSSASLAAYKSIGCLPYFDTENVCA